MFGVVPNDMVLMFFGFSCEVHFTIFRVVDDGGDEVVPLPNSAEVSFKESGGVEAVDGHVVFVLSLVSWSVGGWVVSGWL